MPWIRLNETFVPKSHLLRVVLNKIPEYNGKCLAQLFYAGTDVAIQNPLQLIASEPKLTPRQRTVLKIFGSIDLFARQQDQFVLTEAQFANLLTYTTDAVIEVLGQGVISQHPTEASLVAVPQPAENGQHTVSFGAFVDDTRHIEDGRVYGGQECYLFDPARLHVYPLKQKLVAEEARALLQSEPLSLTSLAEEDILPTFEAIAGLGVDFSCLTSFAKKADPAPQIFLRAILTSGFGGGALLRLHLVTQFAQGEWQEEVEIPSRGNLPPVFPVDKKENNASILFARPTALEEQARGALFQIGAVSAREHRGFTARGQNALNILAKIAHRQGIPAFVHIDEETLPKIVKLPDVPTLSIETTTNLDELIAHLDLSELAGFAPDLTIASILEAHRQNNYTIALSEDVLLTFSRESAERLGFVAEILDLETLSSQKTVSFLEAGLLTQILGDQLNIECSPELKNRLSKFVPKLLPEDHQLPATLQTALRPYQHDAVAWLSQLHRAGLGRLLADDMGLGKTLMVLTLIAKIREQEGQKPNLVVAPTSVIDVWILEAQKHIPALKVVRWHGPDRKGQLPDVSQADLVVTSYALLRMDALHTLQNIPFRYLILDEAQNVRNPRTESFKAAHLIKSDQRMALTGTPIENRVADLWSILELVVPGAMGRERAFQKRYLDPIAKGDNARLNELRARVRPLILRRKKEDVESDLPPKIENLLKCEMSPEQRALYVQILQMARKELADLMVKKSGNNTLQMPMLAALTRLRQACCHPALLPVPGAAEITSAKVELLNEVLADCLSNNRRIIIYSQFVKMQRIIHEVLTKHNVHDALWLHGATRNRAEVVEKFQRPDGPRVIVVSLKAGGTGVTLTAADTVIFYDPWWNPAVEDQAADRAHRIGQTKTVHVIRLVCANSIEEQILALAQQKRALAKDILTADGPGQRSLTMDEIRALLMSELERAEPINTL